MKKLRPIPGTVIAIPLSDGVFAYALVLCGSALGVYDVLTSVKLEDPRKLASFKWRWPLWFLQLPLDSSEVGILTLDQHRLEPPPVFERVPSTLAKATGISPLRIYHRGAYQTASETDIVGLHQFKRVVAESLKMFIEERREKMMLVPFDRGGI